MRAVSDSEPRAAERTHFSSRERLVRTCWAIADITVVGVSSLGAAMMRFDFDVERSTTPTILTFTAVAMVTWLICGALVGPYLVHHLRGSFEETAELGRAALASMLVLIVAVVFGPSLEGVPRSLALSAPLFSVLGMFALRLVVRSYRWGRTSSHAEMRKVIVFGAGEGGRQLIRALQRDSASKFEPVAILDDDPRKRRLKIDGVRVRGTRADLEAVAERRNAEALVIAAPSADANLVRDLRLAGREAGLEVLILPPVEEFIGSRPEGGDLRSLNLEDLLGRRRTQLDEAAIAESIAGKVVLVTGAGGSIGSELARQVHRYGPKKLILLDRDESALHSTQLSLTGRALLDDGTLALVDIRDEDALRALFTREQPQVVFHAAALKHLTLLEQFPLEGWKTNVLGTRNVLRAAEECGVETFVNISTDKAANPSCILGYSKRLAERLTADFAAHGAGRYVSVRFGNVLGSRGSVITAFTAQIERGGPVTVTHPEVERYFMLIPEACQLVLQASVIGGQGNVMVLDMGSPVKIVEVARTLIDMSGRKDVDIVYTGLRPGEKMSEELFIPGEDILLSDHPMVRKVTVPSISEGQVVGTEQTDPQVAYDWMKHEATKTIEGTRVVEDTRTVEDSRTIEGTKERL